MDDKQREELITAHLARFRAVSNKYPRMVAYAYGGDIATAAAASDEEVAEAVAAWERSQGLEPRDWYRIGAEDEGRAEDDE
jgi:hypothetical protein